MKKTLQNLFVIALLLGVALSLTPEEVMAVAATGGTITTNGTKTVHTFTTVGSNSFTVTTGGNVEVLVVAGGGGSGSNGGGGGGGGGVLYSASLAVTPQTYTVTVGVGGAGTNNNAQAGGNSIFSTLTAIGGGGGGSRDTDTAGKAGGSGGGGGGAAAGTSGGTGTAGQGLAGGTGSAGGSNAGPGGGGGCGHVGYNGGVSVGGNGGIGCAYTIRNGSSVYYGGGGGGGIVGGFTGTPGTGGSGGGGNGVSPGGAGNNGTANTGGGAGGNSATGGSGIVIISYLTPLANGNACSTGSDCSSTYCVNSVCCNTVCTGSTCQRCDSYSNAGAGTCGYVSSSTDPNNQCAAYGCSSWVNGWSSTNCTAYASTASDGMCSGSGYACATSSLGTSCTSSGAPTISSCGSTGCKKPVAPDATQVCVNGSASTTSNTTAKVCYTSGKHGCGNGQVCDTTGTCITPPGCSSLPLSGDYTISGVDCALSGTVNGLDSGTGQANTAKLTIGSGSSLTILSGQTIAVGSLDLTTGGTINIVSGGSIKLGAGLYVDDADGDGYPSSNISTQYVSGTGGTITIDNADTVANWTSSDGTNSPIAQETTLKNEGSGSVKVQTTALSSGTLDLMEYTTDANAQAAYVTSSVYAASGGTITSSGGYSIHTFTAGGSLVLKGSDTVDYLIVGGGGGGGGRGGGGAGGFLAGTTSVSPQTYTIVVGGGGGGSANGGNSSFNGIIASGGGAGGDTAAVGGSGGGGQASWASGTAGQGYAGAGGFYDTYCPCYGGGGGGGGGGVGNAGNSGGWAGAGGYGASSSISGSAVTYAGGGGGKGWCVNLCGSGLQAGGGGSGGGGTGDGMPTWNSYSSGWGGSPNTGGGGGGGSYSGGSGIVIVRYPSPIPLQAFFESGATNKTEGGYSLKAIAYATNSVNDTLTKTVSPTKDLSNMSSITFDVKSSRTGSNIKFGFHDSGGVTTEITPNVVQANVFQSVTLDLSGVSNANKDVIDKIIITITNAAADNTFYVDNIKYGFNGSVGSTITSTKSAIDLSHAATISFWVNSTQTGSFAQFQFGESASGEQTFPFTINSPNTWEKKTWTISGITGTSRDAVTKFAFQFTGNTSGAAFYFDNIQYTSIGRARRYLTTDCDDTNASIFRTVAGYLDADSDGYGVGTYQTCVGATGNYTANNNTDCNDADPTRHTSTIRMVAAGDGTNGLAYSSDGLTWTGLGTAIFNTTGNATRFNGTKWIAAGEGTVNTMAYSNDGITWTGMGKAIFTTGARSIDWDGTRWVATGNGPNTLAYSSDGTTWTGLGSSIFTSAGRFAVSNGTQWLAGGMGTNTLAYSSNGITWTGIGLAMFNTAGRYAAWNGSKWTAAGVGTNKIAYSTNGITWTGLGNKLWANGAYAIAWNGTRWVAGGNDTNNTLGYSTDGITWTASPSGNRTYTTSAEGRIAWNGSMFVAGTNICTGASCPDASGNTLMYSNDGIVWTGLGHTIFTSNYGEDIMAVPAPNLYPPAVSCN